LGPNGPNPSSAGGSAVDNLRRHFHINRHEADLVFGRGLPHKINTFDEIWVENAKAKNINQLQVLSHKCHGQTVF